MSTSRLPIVGVRHCLHTPIVSTRDPCNSPTIRQQHNSDCSSVATARVDVHTSQSTAIMHQLQNTERNVFFMALYWLNNRSVSRLSGSNSWHVTVATASTLECSKLNTEWFCCSFAFTGLWESSSLVFTKHFFVLFSGTCACVCTNDV